jgi:hypothetical protein
VTDVSEVLATSIIRAMNKPLVKRFFERGLFICLLMAAVSTTETSVIFYQVTRHNVPEDSNLHTKYWSENVK